MHMLAEVTAMQLYCLRLGRLKEAGGLTDAIAALAKLNNTVKAREVIAEARNLLGGNGILLEYHVIRHMSDIEAIYTYEGTEAIQTLIVGRDITGQSAFTDPDGPSAASLTRPRSRRTTLHRPGAGRAQRLREDASTSRARGTLCAAWPWSTGGSRRMRLIRAVRELNAEHGYGIRVIALHTEAERRATFVRAADEAVAAAEHRRRATPTSTTRSSAGR